uniref:Uncharacterized protein n=1 Tax=viral metagenome TaxID=1070528 RepID=A0A6H1ZWB6_9ZZZZ
MKLVSKIINIIKKEIAIWSISAADMKRIDRYVMTLPTKDIDPRTEIYNKHLQNILWTFWFGKLLHK